MPLTTTAIAVAAYPWVSGFFGGVISQIAKSFVDSLWTLDIFIRQRVLQNMNSNDEPIAFDGKYIIPNDPLIEEIVDKLTSDFYGVLVLGAPKGTGKSTFIKMALLSIKSKQLNANWKLIKSGRSAFNNKNIHEHLQIPSDKSLSDYLPSNSVIILDQIDFAAKSLSDSLRDYVTEIATDATNSQKYKLVVCVSDASITNDILSCNGYEKIQRLCSFPSLFVWSNDQLDQFIDLKLPNLNEDHIQRIRDIAHDCRNSPGLITYASSLCKKGSVPDIEWGNLKNYANEAKESWSQFYGDNFQTE